METQGRETNGFLVAKGRFISNYQKELETLLSQGVSTTDKRIYELKQLCDKERKNLEKNHVKQLAFAIMESVKKHNVAVIRCIGRDACYNASKSVAIALNKFMTQHQTLLNVEICFDEGNLGLLKKESHVQNVTALLYKVRAT